MVGFSGDGRESVLKPSTDQSGAMEGKAVALLVGEISSFGIALLALFLVGMGIGNDHSIRLMPLVLALASTAVLYGICALSPPARSASGRAHKPRRYSEQRLMEQWPRRAAKVENAATSGLDAHEQAGN